MKKGKPFGVFAEILTSYLSRLGLSWERKPPKMPPIKFQKIISSGLTLAELRHTFASIAITNGADVASVSEALGHSDKAVTLRMYTHADQESISQAAQIVRGAIEKAGQG